MMYEILYHTSDINEAPTCCDNWDFFACVDNGSDIGLDYNLCYESDGDKTYCASAFYRMNLNEEENYYETDYDVFCHYEIDFNSPNWFEEFVDASKQILQILANGEPMPSDYREYRAKRTEELE